MKLINQMQLYWCGMGKIIRGKSADKPKLETEWIVYIGLTLELAAWLPLFLLSVLDAEEESATEAGRTFLEAHWQLKL